MYLGGHGFRSQLRHQLLCLHDLGPWCRPCAVVRFRGTVSSRKLCLDMSLPLPVLSLCSGLQGERRQRLSSEEQARPCVAPQSIPVSQCGQGAEAWVWPSSYPNPSVPGQSASLSPALISFPREKRHHVEYSEGLEVGLSRQVCSACAKVRVPFAVLKN